MSQDANSAFFSGSAFLRESIEKHRAKLLDTSRRNNMISFRHSERSRRHIRLIDELPDFLYGAFIDGRKFSFRALPEEVSAPPEEETHEFLLAVEQAQLTDEEYLKAISAVSGDEKDAVEQKKKIERDLRNRIRRERGIAERREPGSSANTETARTHGLDPSYEMPEPPPDPSEARQKHTDKFIQTLLTPSEMERKLRGLNSYINSDIEERGVNTLYAAFGFLEWRESASSEKPLLAPLLLLQLEIEKKLERGRHVYTVKHSGAEPETNLSLSKLLRDDFGIGLPELEGEDGPETYMERVAERIRNSAIPGRENWRVRRFVTIGRFSFARLVMFEDLDEKRWPEGKGPFSSSVLQSLLAGPGDSLGETHAEEYDIDTPEVEKMVPLLVTSADASQHSAIVDVMKGRSLAIQGPPGTGKSQTITNLIACAMAKGKTVLFLAEKMAALNVVHNRLSEAGLGPYCLELHSTKAKKTEVLKSIKERLEIIPNKDRESWYFRSKIEEFRKQKELVTRYADALNSEFGRRRRSVHEHLWATQLLRDRVGELGPTLNRVKIPFEEADLTESEISAHSDELRALAALKKDFDRDAESGRHPWFFITRFGLNPFERDDLAQLAGEWKQKIGETLGRAEALGKRFLLKTGTSASGLGSFFAATRALAGRTAGDLDQNLIGKLRSRETAESLCAFAENVEVCRSAEKSVVSLRDVRACVGRTGEIGAGAKTAADLGAGDLTAAGIRAKAEELERKKEFWEKNLETLSGIGGRFGVSGISDTDQVLALADLPEHAASMPADYSSLRTEELAGGTCAHRLAAAIEKQKTIHAMETLYDLSMFGEPKEIRMQAAIVQNAGFFAFLDSSYRAARKVLSLASKEKAKLGKEEAAEELREIADAVEESGKIERDAALRSMCGPSFRGADTDFEKLLEINEWAAEVRRRYVSADGVSENLRDRILLAGTEDADFLRSFASDRKLAQFREEVRELANSGVRATAEEHMDGFADGAEKLRNAASVLDGAARSADTTFEDIARDLPFLREAERARREAEKDPAVEPLLGGAYAGADTDISGIAPTAQFVREFLSSAEMADGFPRFFEGSFAENWSGFREERKSLETLLSAAEEDADRIESLSGISFPGTSSWKDIPLGEIVSFLAQALANPGSLSGLLEFKAHLEKSGRDVKAGLVSLYVDNNLDFDTLPTAFEYAVHRSVTETIYERVPVLASASGLKLEQARRNIQELDAEVLKLQQKEIGNILSREKPLAGIGKGKRGTWTENALLHNEITKKRRHIPIRELMKRAGKSIRKIKPCFLMSPLTVAQYLGHEDSDFDLVVIDEASQMRPEDALGAAVRSKQIIVVGDPKQLPPTSFFQAGGDEEEEEDFDMESIMDMALQCYRPYRMLNRHYRSRHESLIAFSNHHFYEKSLVLFPSPVDDPEELGLKLEEVDGIYTARSNMKEVEAVVKSSLEYMRRYPDRSLGIATMNLVQKDLIEAEMDRAFVENPHAAQYRRRWQNTLEPFFVKNLESVQGDERDAIFISTVYGPDKNDVLRQNFGPINRAGGHRRLNVLFTRSKRNMVVFTSLKPQDIKISDSSSEGIRALRAFLIYASRGMIESGERIGREPDSDFERFVKQKLESIGCEAHPQVGVAGYRIDLGVKHPGYPYGYLLGVECDGATYHSSRSARERDVIRQQVLENLGWSIYRIWSTDWFSNSRREFEKLAERIRELLRIESERKAEAAEAACATADGKEDEEKPEDPDEGVETDEEEEDDATVKLFDRVSFLIAMEGEKEEERTAEIVPTQSDLAAGKISRHSAVGRALMGCREGDEVEVALRRGEATLTVTKIARPGNQG